MYGSPLVDLVILVDLGQYMNLCLHRREVLGQAEYGEALRLAAQNAYLSGARWEVRHQGPYGWVMQEIFPRTPIPEHQSKGGG